MARAIRHSDLRQGGRREKEPIHRRERSGSSGVGYITVICMLLGARLFSQPTAISQSAVEDRSSSTNDCLHVACFG